LAYVYDGRFPPVAVARAAAGLCEVVWVIDSSDPLVAESGRVFRRFGAGVVDVAGMPLERAVEAIARESADGIITQGDSQLEWTAQVADRLGLPFLSERAAACAEDKYAQRVALRDAGVAVPGFWTVPDESDQAAWSALAGEAHFPAVLKPCRGSASANTMLVSSFDELRTASREANGSGEMILEEYLVDRPGAGGEGFASYCSVESLLCHGHIHHLVVCGRMPPAPPFREAGGFLPSALAPADLAAVKATASDAMRAIGATIGCLHTEIKLTPQGPRVIEINARIGGPVPRLLERVSTVEILPLAIRAAFGETIAVEDPLPTGGVAFTFWLFAPMHMREITAVDGLDHWSELRPDDELTLHRRPGDPVDWREGGHGRVAVIFGTAHDHDELRHLADRFNNTITIRGNPDDLVRAPGPHARIHTR
jgi:hypothetical protein